MIQRIEELEPQLAAANVATPDRTATKDHLCKTFPSLSSNF